MIDSIRERIARLAGIQPQTGEHATYLEEEIERLEDLLEIAEELS